MLNYFKKESGMTSKDFLADRESRKRDLREFQIQQFEELDRLKSGEPISSELEVVIDSFPYSLNRINED